MLLKEPTLGYVHQLANQSERMLRATLERDTAAMRARERYRVEREDKSGTGYVDFIFYPESDRKADGIILELKVDHTPEEAIRQIKENIS